jgi:hypothetical protein
MWRDATVQDELPVLGIASTQYSVLLSDKIALASVAAKKDSA